MKNYAVKIDWSWLLLWTDGHLSLRPPHERTRAVKINATNKILIVFITNL
jgi:hypothetical protein